MINHQRRRRKMQKKRIRMEKKSQMKRKNHHGMKVRRHNIKITTKKDITALHHIYQAITPTIFPWIMAATTAKEAWTILKEEYHVTDKVISIKLQTLWKDFDTLLMKEDETI